MNYCIGLSLTFLFVIIPKSLSSNLSVTYCSPILPDTSVRAEIFYDGDDSISILGYGTLVLRYSISKDTLEEIGNLPGRCGYGAYGQADRDGNIFCIGAERDPSDPPGRDIIKFDIVHKNSSTVGHYTFDAEMMPSVLYNDSTIVFFGSQNYMAKFNMDTYALTHPNSVMLDLLYGGVIHLGNGRALMVKSIASDGNLDYRLLWELDLITFQTSQYPNELPGIGLFPCPVSDGRSVFILTGYFESLDPEFSHEGILHFDPLTNVTTYIHVDNWLITNDNPLFFGPSCVYVPKLNRIYGFGGSAMVNFVPRIFYIDLNGFYDQPTTTEAPDPFSCVDRPDGFYPHPHDCSLYFECREGEGTEYRCPPGFMFDPVLQICNHEDQVECSVSKN